MTPKAMQEHAERVTNEAWPDLAAVREDRGLVLSDIARVTKISLLNLKALEKGDFQKLPPPVYTNAYLKAYAGILGIDSQPLLAQYDNHFAVLDRAGEKEGSAVRKQVTGLAYHLYLKRTSIAFFAIAIPLIVAFFIYNQINFRAAEVPVDYDLPQKLPSPEAAIVGPPPPAIEDSAPAKGSQQGGVKEEAAQAKDTQQIPVSQDAGAGKDPANAAIAAKSTPPANFIEEAAKAKGTPPSIVKHDAGNETPKTNVLEKATLTKSPQQSIPLEKTTSNGMPGNSLIITCREETWLRIREGDKTPYQLLMKPGEKTVRRGDKFSMDIGNAAGISIEFQGKKLGPFGKTGEVIHLRLP